MAKIQENEVGREDLLTALYQVSTKSEILTQFDKALSTAKKGDSVTKRYTHLLEQVLFYSHAIIYGHKVQTAHNYRQLFMKIAKDNKALNLSSKKVEEAFKFFNRTEAWDFLTDEEKLADTKRRLEKKESERLKRQHKALEAKIAQPIEEEKTSSVKCIAKDEIKDLKAQLDNKSYKLSRGQKAEDKEAFIMIALVALATGARLSDIMENLKVSTKKSKTYFDDGLTVQEGVILELDTKTVQNYLKSIRKHYSDRIGKIDISTGIRKAVKSLNISISPSIIEEIKEKNKKLKKPKNENIKYCQNTNHLNALYKECLTSSTPK